ncbi:MAG: glycoside hydrolase family 3 C-terminal domain-containing protein [Balneolaceae bacterium]|nr:glycoside hydrolase family 3 C-terminal domain-containing protein [Balneolaceae bacterium]MBO6545782.1 glycoside hydrolase family 3 C-terminal domain-containing protein [Balneolaceae bacterium]MBO6647178.1 glycoside hydrolase family 3 C-terminal domain-containing protein [Balneolaceae bacterium]
MDTPLYKDPSKSPEERVKDLLSQMTLAEKAAQMVGIWNEKKDTLVSESGHFDIEKARKHFGHGNGIGQVGRPSDAGKDEEASHEAGFDARQTVELTNAIQKFFIEESRLGIPVVFHEECLHGLASKWATSFPQPIGLGGTFNPELVEKLYATTAEEARVRGAHQALTPVVDVARDPRWGRVEETFGEDPFLVSQLGVAAVKGFQGDAEFDNKKHVMATLKHFAAHGEPESGQNCGPVNISERVLRETFLVPFKESVEQANVVSIMASYNEIDAIPSHANPWLLKDVLRDEWGFKGFVVSDYYAIWELNDRPDTHGHGIAKDKKHAAELAIKAGVNIELPEPDCYNHIEELVGEDRLSEAMLDELVGPMLYWKFKMGLFDDPYLDPEHAEKISGSETNKELALQAARETLTLLKNEGDILPLDPTSTKKIAVIGPNATRSLLGGYSGAPKTNITILDGIQSKAKELGVDVIYSEGCKITVGGRWEEDAVVVPTPEENRVRIAQAVKDVEDAEVIVLAIGGNDQTSREAWSAHHMGDRTELDLFGEQDELVDAMVATGKPVIALVVNGRPLSINNVAEKAQGIFECWYLGQEGGNAVAEVLFGEYNPGGKLPISIPKSVGQLPVYYNHRPSARRGFLFDDAKPLFTFGYGLSYTSFELSNAKLNESTIRAEGSTSVSVDVTNTGDCEGSEVVQMYIRDCFSSVTRPVKELKGFQKVWLKPGETKTLSIPITKKSLAFYDISMNYVVEPGDFDIMIGTSSRDEDLTKLTLTVKE